MRGN